MAGVPQLPDRRKEAVDGRYPGGLYIDLHGHGHTIQRLELGYLLGPEELRHPDDSLDTQPAYEALSSIRTLSVRSPLSFSELLRGPSSLGALLEAEGYAAVPSSTTPDPGDNEYFAGGFNTFMHGCRAGGVICGVQIESNRIG